MNRMIDSKLTHMEQLVLITAVRKLISNQPVAVSITELIQSTQVNFMSILTQIFRFDDKLSQEIRSMKLEAIWILSNLACGSLDDLRLLLASQELNLLKIIDDIVVKDIADLIMIEQTMWLVGNICGECVEFRDEILNKTNVLKCMAGLLSAQKLTKSLFKVICWVNHNMTRFRGLTP